MIVRGKIVQRRIVRMRIVWRRIVCYRRVKEYVEEEDYPELWSSLYVPGGTIHSDASCIPIKFIHKILLIYPEHQSELFFLQTSLFDFLSIFQYILNIPVDPSVYSENSFNSSRMPSQCCHIFFEATCIRMSVVPQRFPWTSLIVSEDLSWNYLPADNRPVDNLPLINLPADQCWKSSRYFTKFTKGKVRES